MNEPDLASEEAFLRHSFGLSLLALACVGIALRIALGFESFWLDEAWSYGLATEVGSAAEILGVHHDNNHPLNTLYLFALRDSAGSAHWILYRIPALVCGVLSLWIVAKIAREWGRPATWIALTLVATSFPLISASAQARGYAGAILFSLVYVHLSVRYGRDEGVPSGLAARIGTLAVAATVGMLWHPTFVYPLAGAACFAFATGLERGQGARHALGTAVALHGLPLLVAMALLLGLYAEIGFGGGPSYDRGAALRQAVAQTFGLPRTGAATWAATGLATLLGTLALWTLLRSRRRSWAVFFAITILAAPAAVILVSDPNLLYARYLVTVFPWFYLVVAVALAALWRERGSLRLTAIALLAFIVVSNGVQTSRVLAVGRDDYLNALVFIDGETHGEVLEIGSDHDFRALTLLRFYANWIPSGRSIEYVHLRTWPRDGPEWYLRHDWKAGRNPEPKHEPVPGLAYDLVASFEHGPGDGFEWYVYRRSAAR